MTRQTSLDRLRHPEHVGENRCWPCTALNLVLVAATGGLAALWDPLLALVVVGFGTLLVGVRGYVVPGTPRFAPRLVAGLPVSFGHADGSPDPLSDTSGSATAPAADSDPERVLEALVEAGVVTNSGEELFLDGAFREAWTERMAALRAADDESFLDRVAAACPAYVTGHRHGDRVLLAGDRDVWTSRAVAIAETAAAETLAEWGVDHPARVRAAAPLRTFLRTCPCCGGRVHETTLQNCCGGPGSLYGNPEQPALACEDCGAVVAELETYPES